MTRPDYLRLMHEESRDLADLLATLPQDAWDQPSLCEGWRVRDVVAHMAVGHTISVPAFAAALVRHRLSTDEASFTLAVEYAEAHSTRQVLARFREATAGRPRGAARFVPLRELFTDHLTHHQDIRRPLGLPRVIPSERALAALDSLPSLSGRIGSRARMAGLRVVATDVPFVHGAADLEVRGPAEALVLALTGRVEGLADLTGTGLPVLTRRLPSPAPTRKDA